jgi:hypothetical protein
MWAYDFKAAVYVSYYTVQTLNGNHVTYINYQN